MFRTFSVGAMLFVSLVLLVSEAQTSFPGNASFGGENILLRMADVVGVTAAVPANSYNTLNEQLNEKQAALNAEQEQLNEQQAALDARAKQGGAPAGTNRLLLVALILIADLLLIGANAYLEMKTRLKKVTMEGNGLPPTPSYGSV